MCTVTLLAVIAKNQNGEIQGLGLDSRAKALPAKRSKKGYGDENAPALVK